MRALIQLSFLGWLCLMSLSIFTWWKADFATANHKLYTLLAGQAKALPMTGAFVEKKESIPRQLTSLKLSYIDSPKLQQFMSDALNKTLQAGRLISTATQCMLVKLVLLTMAIPLLSITTLMGLVDGLSQRAIRTACLGRESSYLFHQLKRYAKRGLNIFLAIWLVLPLAITPAFIFIPMSLFTGVITAITVSHFKKYY